MSGTYLSAQQDRLARLWNAVGPQAVYDDLEQYASRMELVSLLMANIGKRAQELEHTTVDT